MSNIRQLPFTELIETVQDISRSSSDDKKRIRGMINRKYTKNLPREFDWGFFKVTTSLDLIAEYNTGVVTINTGTNVCTFSGATITSAMTGRKIKFTNNANVYDFTFTDGTGGTIAPVLTLTTNISQGVYKIFQSTYALPPDFDRFPINGGLLYYSGGQTTPIPEKDDDDYFAEFTASPTTSPDGCRLLGYNTAGNREVELLPPPSQAMSLGLEYLRMVEPLSETTAGLVNITSSGSAVTGTNGTLFTTMNTGDYLRVNAFGTVQDSTWHRITSITNDTTLTVSPTFRSDSSVTAAPYVISSAPEMPPSMHEALVFGPVSDLLPDQNDANYLYYHSEYAQVLSDNKVNILTRKTKDDVELIAEDFNYRR